MIIITQSKSLNHACDLSVVYEPPNLTSGILFINYSINGLADLSDIKCG